MPVGSVAAHNSHACEPSQDSLVIAPAEVADKQRWDEFLTTQESGSFYHLYDWKLINERTLRHECEFLAAKDRNGRIRGVLPLVLVRSRLFGRILCSIPFMNFGGPAAADPQIASRLVHAACDRAAGLGADYLELRCASRIDTQLPVSLHKVSMTLALSADPETLWKNFSSKHRTNIRRAQKNELSVVSGGAELLGDFYSVMERSWRSLGTPLYSREYFHDIVETFGSRIRIFVCSRRGEPIAVAFNGHFGATVEGMWAGARLEHRNLQPNYVLYWEMIRDACERGYKNFHLGRSTADSGAEQFKSKWNAETQQLYWYFHRPGGGEPPQLNVDNPKYRTAINIWRRLPLWATRLLGPPIARLIP